MNSNRIVVPGEPTIVTESRELILNTFKDLVFIEEGHKYYLNGRDLPSVSAVTHQFKPEFDGPRIAANYAKKNGFTPEYWLRKWKFKNLKATTTGTIVHEYGEGLFWLRCGYPDKMPESCRQKYVKDENWLIPTRPKEEAILKYYSELAPYDYPVLSEARVYNNFNPNAQKMKTDYCGTFDLLFYRHNPEDPSQDGFIIRDWKTNGELMSSYSRSKNKNCLAPFADLPDESLSMYILQLSCYQIPLQDLGLNVVEREIIWLKDSGEYELLQLPDFTDRIRAVL